METISALLALCAGNSPVPGEFPPQRPVTRNFDISLISAFNKQLSKSSWGWWFKTPSRPLWRLCNGQVLSVLMNPLDEEKATCCEEVEKWFSRVTQLRMLITVELLHEWTKSHYPWVDILYCILCSENTHSVKTIIDHSFRHSGQRRYFLTSAQINAKLTFTLNINCEYRSSVIRYPRCSEKMVSDTFTIKCILILSQ